MASLTDFSIRETFSQYSTEIKSPPHGIPKQLFHVDQGQHPVRTELDSTQFTSDPAYASVLPNKLMRPPSIYSIQPVHPYDKEHFGVPSTSNQLDVQPDARNQFNTPPTTEENGQFDKPSSSPHQAEATYSGSSARSVHPYDKGQFGVPSTSNQLDVQPDARNKFNTPPTTEENGQFDKPSSSPHQAEATYSGSSARSVHPYDKGQFGVPSTSNQLDVQPDARNKFNTPPTTEENGQFDKPSSSPHQAEATYSGSSARSVHPYDKGQFGVPSTSNQLDVQPDARNKFNTPPTTEENGQFDKPSSSPHQAEATYSGSSARSVHPYDKGQFGVPSTSNQLDVQPDARNQFNTPPTTEENGQFDKQSSSPHQAVHPYDKGQFGVQSTRQKNKRRRASDIDFANFDEQFEKIMKDPQFLEESRRLQAEEHFTIYHGLYAPMQNKLKTPGPDPHCLPSEKIPEPKAVDITKFFFPVTIIKDVSTWNITDERGENEKFAVTLRKHHLDRNPLWRTQRFMECLYDLNMVRLALSIGKFLKTDNQLFTEKLPNR